MYHSRLAFALAMAALAAILLPSSLIAQVTFQRTYGGEALDVGASVQQTSDGGYAIAGYTYSYGAGGSDVYLVKTDSNGDTLWTKTYGGDSTDCGCSVAQTASLGYVISGYTHSNGAGRADVYLINTDANGEILWTRSYGGGKTDVGYSGQQTIDGGYVVAGWTTSFAPRYAKVYLIKTGADGEALWTGRYGHAGNDCGWSVRQTVDSGYIVTGYTVSGSSNENVLLVKTNVRGESLWAQTYAGADTDRGYSVRQTTDGGYIIAGYTKSHGAGDYDVYLIKTDDKGDTTWTRTFGGNGDDRGCSVWQTTDGGYIVAGQTSSFGAGSTDAYLVKTNASGDSLWTRTFGGTGDDEAYSIQQTIDGGYIIAGHTQSFGAGQGDVYLIKIDSSGNVAVAEPKTSPTRASDLAIACQPNPATGTTTIHLTPFAVGLSDPCQTVRLSPLALRIYDAQGRMVHSVSGIRASSFALDLRALPSGAYFIRGDIAKEHATARLVVQR